MPHLRTPQSRAMQQDRLMQAARTLNHNDMDMACSRGAQMGVQVVDAMVQASRGRSFHPLRLVECIRCAVRWNADLTRTGPDKTSAGVVLLQALSQYETALPQARRLLDHSIRGRQVWIQGQPVAWHEAADRVVVKDATPVEDQAGASTPSPSKGPSGP